MKLNSQCFDEKFMKFEKKKKKKKNEESNIKIA